MALLSGTFRLTVPLKPKSELAVISLRLVNCERNWSPKIPEDVMLIVPPRPRVALAVMSLFSLGIAMMNPPLKVIVPPVPVAWLPWVPAVAVIWLLFRRSKSLGIVRMILPPLTVAD